MTPRFRLGRAAFLLVLALPALALALREGQPWPLVAFSAPLLTFGLLLVDDRLHAQGYGSVAVVTLLLVLYGTPLVGYVMAEADWAGFAFFMGALLAHGEARRTGRGRAAVEAVALGLLLAALALSPERWDLTLALGHPVLLDGLFSSSHGVLFWAPVLTVAVVTLAVRAGRGEPTSRTALIALAVVALASAVVRPWSAGGIANARVVPALPLLALGLAAALDPLRVSAQRRPLRVLAAAGAVLVAWNVLFMAQYRREMIPRDDTVAFPAVAENAALLLASAVGSPPAWPANWLFAARHGLPAARYDRLGGRDLLAALPAEIDIGDLDSDQALLAEGWSVRHPCLGAVCREVEGRARVLLPVIDPRAAELRVRALGTGTLRVSLQGASAEGALHPTFGEIALPLPRRLLHAGANEVVLEVSPGGQALVDALRLLPAEGAP
jgi:hypothetical protein